MFNKAKHKTRLTQKKEKRRSKTHKKCKQKQEERKRKVIESLGALFLPHPRRTFPLIKPLNQWRGERIETVQVRKEHEGLKMITERRER